MTKKYYVNENEIRENGERAFLVLEEKNIEKVLNAEGYIFTSNINDLEEYEDGTGRDSYLNYEEHKNDMFLYQDYYTSEELDLVHYRDLETKEEKELFEVLKEKFKTNGNKGHEFEEMMIYESWNGSNWETEILEAEYTEWQDWTEEFEGMEEIDEERKNTGIYTLYRLPNHTKNALVYTSYYQGVGETMEFVNKEYKTVQEYLDSVSENY